MEHLALEVFDRDGKNGQFLFLSGDTSITIIETSDLFDRGDIWSFEFKLNIPANAHIFGTAGEIHGSRLHDQVDKLRMRLWVENMPVYLGYLRLDDEVEVDTNGDVSVRFESGRKTFYNMVEGVNANQVPIPDDIHIGMAIERERQFATTGAEILAENVYGREYETFLTNLLGEKGLAQDYPKFVTSGKRRIYWKSDSDFFYSTPGMFINTDVPYDAAHPYCNTRICYQQKKFNADGDNLEEVATRTYKTSEADRVNSAPNFYVLYWIKILMQHIGVSITENQMLDVEDLRRLFFFNTKCAYRPGDRLYSPWEPDDHTMAVKMLPSCTTLATPAVPYVWEPASPFIAPQEEEHKTYEITATPTSEEFAPFLNQFHFVFDEFGTIPTTESWQKAFATSDNFPNVGISDVIEAIESGFGVRLLFNRNHTQVRIVLLRNVLRSGTVHTIPTQVLEVTKTDNCIRGFRMTYGSNEDDTLYHYRGFDLLRQNQEKGWVEEGDGHDYGQWNTDYSYAEIKKSIDTLNKTCYIDNATGNSYIVKVDRETKDFAGNYNATLFECAAFMDAEDGVCSDDKETVKEIRVGFSPIVLNTTENGYAVFVDKEMGVSRSLVTTKLPGLLSNSVVEDYYAVTTEPVPTGTVSEEDGDDEYTYHTQENIGFTRRIVEDFQSMCGLFEIASTTRFTAVDSQGRQKVFTWNVSGIPVQFTLSGTIREGYRLHLDDNYKPDDELTCPLEKEEWGLTLGIMRGSGSDSSISYHEDNIDIGNDYWEIVPGSHSYAHSDTCDDEGNVWDYGGQTDYTMFCTTPADAINAMQSIFQDSNFDLIHRSSSTYLTGYYLATVEDNNGTQRTLLLAADTKDQSPMPWTSGRRQYIDALFGKTPEQMLALDAQASNVIIDTDSSREKAGTLLKLQLLAYAGGGHVTISDGTDVREGRVSLKLRAEKPNPFFDSSLPESNSNPRYLEITNPNLSRRGLIDQFHKEESYWWRNAKTAHIKCRMGIAELLGIDKTVRQRIGDFVGFVKKIQYSVSIGSGLSDLDIEILYL